MQCIVILVLLVMQYFTWSDSKERSSAEGNDCVFVVSMAKSVYGCGSSSIEADAALGDTIRKIGLETLKPKQHDGIQSPLSGNDTLVVLPTYLLVMESLSYTQLFH